MAKYFAVRTANESFYLLKFHESWSTDWQIAFEDGVFIKVISFPGATAIILPVKASTQLLKADELKPDEYLKIIGHTIMHAAGRTAIVKQIVPVNL